MILRRLHKRGLSSVNGERDVLSARLIVTRSVSEGVCESLADASGYDWMRLRRATVVAAFALVYSAFIAMADERPLRETIDDAVRVAWEREKVEPAGVADDATFLRRVYLDLTGMIPSYEQTLEFLDDESADKRAKLIDRLLADPRYAVHQADVWDMVLFGRDPASNEARTRDGFQSWLRDQFANNVPYNKIVDQILRAEGNTVEHGAPMYLVQYARSPEDGAVAVTQTFLGVQLQCARCHDHPFENWSQLDFYGMAAFLARLQTVTVGKKGRDAMIAVGEKNLGDVLFTGPAIEDAPGKKGEPVKAKFLLGDELVEPALPADFDEPRNFPANKMPPKPQFSRKDKLAEWITSPSNPYFAKAVANRVWAQFMGRGLVDPVDNMSNSNRPSHPELLDALAAAIVEHNFDLKWYIRELCNSQTYQLAASGPVEDAKPRWFERARVRPLSAEELAESWRVATDYDQAMKQAGKEPGDDRFFGLTSGYMLRFFGEPDNGVGDFQGGLQEHLYLNNGQVASLITSSKGGLHDTLLNSDQPWEQRVDRLFLSVLSRPPLPEERQKFTDYIIADKDRPHDRLKEAIWTLMSCSEFRFNH